MKPFLVLILLLVITYPVIAQDTTYYDKEGQKVETLHEADYCEMVVFQEGDSLAASLQQFFTNGTKKAEANYTDFKNKKKEGTYRSWYKNGKQHREIEYDNGKIDGKLMTWWTNGKVKRSDVYRNDTLVSGRCYDSTGTEIPFYKYEIMPEYPGGETALYKFISKQVRYPASAREEGIQGRVKVSFFVDRNGNIIESTVIDSPDPSLASEALRVINMMPPWKPGMIDGEKTGVRYNLPVTFTLR